MADVARSATEDIERSSMSYIACAVISTCLIQAVIGLMTGNAQSVSTGGVGPR